MSNRLSHETSPYLRQHAENPVDWYPWGEEALRRVREEDKPIYVLVGYAACHGCHVMAHESFENPDIARLRRKYGPGPRGGFGDAPKFPNPSCHDPVLRVYHWAREPQLLAPLERTLDRMATGGIDDHLGGGYARYYTVIARAPPENFAHPACSVGTNDCCDRRLSGKRRAD